MYEPIGAKDSPHLSEYSVLRLVAHADRLRLHVSGSPDFRILRSKRILVGTVSYTVWPLSVDQIDKVDLKIKKNIPWIFKYLFTLEYLKVFVLNIGCRRP